jgi:hypothetical protein
LAQQLCGGGQQARCLLPLPAELGFFNSPRKFAARKRVKTGNIPPKTPAVAPFGLPRELRVCDFFFIPE